MTLQLDSKDRPGNPTHGFEASFSGGLYQQVNSDDFGYWKYSADLTRYLHLFYDRILVLRVAAQRMDPLEGRSIPFYDLSELGRKETIRGFSRGRFRDRDMILASAEYRYPIWRNWDEYGIDFLLFADAGQVSPDLFEEASWENFQMGLGFGMRLWDQDGLALKLEAGWSAEEWRIYFVLN
jgi:outer membrane protein assembly factor BamA